MDIELSIDNLDIDSILQDDTSNHPSLSLPVPQHSSTSPTIIPLHFNPTLDDDDPMDHEPSSSSSSQSPSQSQSQSPNDDELLALQNAPNEQSIIQTLQSRLDETNPQYGVNQSDPQDQDIILSLLWTNKPVPSKSSFFFFDQFPKISTSIFSVELHTTT
eukprot:TRINITY_DN1587_c0_g1_i2.p2 TRINITY_DN1587_c0_g1~~TRINITY_DN1587_c0_g1_i2.p2  ORF type:complete len:184 (+),score=37.99 TRINITY_DN1587_c0_g1_i2:74-553(+)